MSIFNKVLIWLIFVAAIAFFLLGARALQTHKYWRDQVAEQTAKLATVTETIAEREGQTRDLSVELHAVVIDRGRVWYGCRPGMPDPSGTLAVRIEFPAPHGIAPQTVLYAFDERNVADGGFYLGQFVATNVDQQGVQLQPSLQLSPAELKRLQASAGRNAVTWALYETMPVDNHVALADLDEATLKAELPKETVEEYLLDGQMATVGSLKQRGLRGRVYRVDEQGEVVRYDGPEEKKKGLEVEVESEDEEGMFVRQLRDYEEIFRDCHITRYRLFDKLASAARNKRYVDDALADAQQHVIFRQKERDQLLVDKGTMSKQRDLASSHHQEVEQALGSVQKAVESLISRVHSAAAQIAKHQLDAERAINQRLQAMAQAGSGS